MAYRKQVSKCQIRWLILCTINSMHAFKFYRMKCQVSYCDNYNIKAYSGMYYDCLKDSTEFHYFCDDHANQLECPIHFDGRRWCEVTECNNLAKKYTRITYTCLSEGDYHFFCNTHYQSVNCKIHSTGYRR